MTGSWYPLCLRASRLDGGAPPPPPLVATDKWKIWERHKGKKERKNGITPLPPVPLLSHKPWARSIPLLHLGGNFPTSVATKKSITAWSQSCMVKSSEICPCRHLPAFQPITFSTPFHRSLWWFLHRLQWRKRCSCVWDTVPPHHQHWSSSRWPNHLGRLPWAHARTLVGRNWQPAILRLSSE